MANHLLVPITESILLMLLWKRRRVGNVSMPVESVFCRFVLFALHSILAHGGNFLSFRTRFREEFSPPMFADLARIGSHAGEEVSASTRFTLSSSQTWHKSRNPFSKYYLDDYRSWNSFSIPLNIPIRMLWKLKYPYGLPGLFFHEVLQMTIAHSVREGLSLHLQNL